MDGRRRAAAELLYSILQTHDGYLWLTTFDGLVRFDGVRFTVVSTATNTVTAIVPVGELPTSIALAVRTQGPTGKDQCKNGGWQTFTNPSFKNQGDCVSFVNHMNHEQ